MNQSERVQILVNVSQFLEHGKRNFPLFSKHFDRCFDNIKKEVYPQTGNSNQDAKKQEIKDLLETSITDYVRINEEEILARESNFTSVSDLINHLRALKIAIENAQKRVITLSESYGKWLYKSQKFLSPQEYKLVEKNCGYCKKSCRSFIWLHKLCERFPKIKRSSAPTRLLFNNKKIVEEICEENEEFWSTE